MSSPVRVPLPPKEEHRKVFFLWRGEEPVTHHERETKCEFISSSPLTSTNFHQLSRYFSRWSIRIPCLSRVVTKHALYSWGINRFTLRSRCNRRYNLVAYFAMNLAFVYAIEVVKEKDFSITYSVRTIHVFVGEIFFKCLFNICFTFSLGYRSTFFVCLFKTFFCGFSWCFNRLFFWIFCTDLTTWLLLPFLRANASFGIPI